jgi:putative DNA primase/helicase
MSGPDLRKVCAAFADAMSARGLVPPRQLIADGRIHRCDVTGKPGKSGRGDGSYLLHAEGIPAGGFENWTDGGGWENWTFYNGCKLSESERVEAKHRSEAVRAANEALVSANAAKARQKAQRLWSSAMPATEGYPYLARKHVQAHGLRIKYGALLVPTLDASGAIQSLQFISASGAKRFLKGGRIRGGYYRLPDATSVESVIIAEGFATAATIAEATGFTTIVAFNSHNLSVVAESINGATAHRVVIAADARGGNVVLFRCWSCAA